MQQTVVYYVRSVNNSSALLQRHHLSDPTTMGENQVSERESSVAPVVSRVLTVALSSNATNLNSACPVPPSIGDSAINSHDFFAAEKGLYL